MVASGKMFLSTLAVICALAPRGVVGVRLRPTCTYSAQPQLVESATWYARASPAANGTLPHLGSSKMVHSNLGGLGPDDGEQSIIIAQTGNSSETTFNMKITVAEGSFYLGDVSNNNLSNGLLSINVEAGLSVSLDVEMFDSLNVPRAVPRLLMTTLDIDAGSISGVGEHPHKKAGVEGVSFINTSAYYMYDYAMIKTLSVFGNDRSFVANLTGNQADNPTTAWGLTRDQKMKAAMVEFHDVSRFRMLLIVRGEEGVMTGRNFLMTGLSELVDASFGPCDDAQYLELGTSNLTRNNLAGVDPGPQVMKFVGAAVIKGTSIDLVVSVVNGTYNPSHLLKNGLSGKLGQINMGVNDSATFAFSFFETGTCKPVEINNFFFSFYDIDQSENGHEALTVASGKGTYFLSKATSLTRVVNDDGSVTFTSSAFGSSGNNPRNPGAADDNEAVTLYFQEAVSSFTITYDTVSNAGRNFLFGGITETACPSST